MGSPSTKLTLCTTDIHGCGLELQELIKISGIKKENGDQLILAGDLFDRACHGHLVWQIIQDWGSRCYCLMGNHERKMLKYLLNERKDLPAHYYWAMNNLKRNGVKIDDLRGFLEKLPTIFVWSVKKPIWIPMKGDPNSEANYGSDILTRQDDIIIAHAGININNPLDPAPSFTVYGDVRNTPWWDRYIGENLVLYGHLSEIDQKPRIRHIPWETGMEEMRVNSIGLDTAAAHGGFLTGYIIETREFKSVKAVKDWTSELRGEMPRYDDKGQEVN